MDISPGQSPRTPPDSQQLDSSCAGTRTAADRRAADRTPTSDVWCDQGRLIDLSPRGMRLTSRRRWRPGVVRKVTITDGGHSVTLDARCIWERHEGLFRHTIGLAFDRVAPEHEGMLLRLAAEHSGQ
ncbi:MAG: PilZ domain-containing protein [Planctomycetota bacterium]|nr:PilZ domain-containing protein [Planctomycetota bacterium]